LLKGERVENWLDYLHTSYI